MRHLKSCAIVAALVATIGIAAAAQEPPPAGAFRAVHLVNLTSQQVAALQAWMADMNAVLTKEGHKEVRYRLYKVIGKRAGEYEFMWESSWPSGAVYTKVHDNPAWKSVEERHPGVSELTKNEIYNRYVDVTSQRRER
jgi:hypothetical protein